MKTVVTVALFTFLLIPAETKTVPQEHNYLEHDSGNDLLAGCSHQDGFYVAACKAYIDGVLDGFRLTAQGEAALCIPDHATNKQIYDIVAKSLRDHPQNRQDPASILVVNSLLDVWSCKKK